MVPIRQVAFPSTRRWCSRSRWSAPSNDVRRDLILTALRRGLTKRCPHCGQGRLFEGWSRHLDRCSVCGLVYERNPGDTWAFTSMGARLPIAAIIALIYFGYGRSHHVLGVLTFLALGALLVW